MLEWALVDGVRVEAKSFRNVIPSERPTGVCPCCREKIVWKAGNIVRPHVAHAPDSTCSATNPETAAHLNAKYKILRHLQEVSVLLVKSYCKNCPSKPVEFVAARGWQDAKEEYFSKQTSRVPDVALIDEFGKIMLAVEVFHTNKVDEFKSKDYEIAGIDWIEVTSKEVALWEEGSPLNATAYSIGSVCEDCEIQDRWSKTDKLLSDFNSNSRNTILNWSSRLRSAIDAVRSNCRCPACQVSPVLISQMTNEECMLLLKRRIDIHTHNPKAVLAIAACKYYGENSQPMASVVCCKITGVEQIVCGLTELSQFQGQARHIKAALKLAIDRLDLKAPEASVSIVSGSDLILGFNLPPSKYWSDTIQESLLRSSVFKKRHYIRLPASEEEHAMISKLYRFAEEMIP